MMLREPTAIPAERGIYALINRKRRFAYVAFTQNLQKRSHSMSHMLLSHDDWLNRKGKKSAPYWPIKELPKHASDEYAFVVLSRGIAPDRALNAIAIAQSGFVRKNYAVIGGHRAGSPVVSLDGRRQPLSEVVRNHTKLKYVTVYRRIQRGWTVKQALGLDPPDPRWHKDKQAERRARAKAA
jgi:hypothetical protein